MRVLLLLLLAAPAFGHGGKVDAYGCHRDKKRGGYHCHKGEFNGHFWKTRKQGRQEMDAWRKAQALKREASEMSGFPDHGCAPMDARGSGRGRAAFGWTWNGVSCIHVNGSRCEGEDCKRLYRTRQGCDRARYRCPASTEYYRTLESECGRFDACCKRSVERMRLNGTRRAVEDGCPKDYSRDMLRCESSYTWCVPAPAPADDDEDDGESR